MNIDKVDDLFVKMSIVHQSLMKIKDNTQKFSISELRIFKNNISDLIIVAEKLNNQFDDEIFKSISLDLDNINSKMEK